MRLLSAAPFYLAQNKARYDFTQNLRCGYNKGMLAVLLLFQAQALPAPLPLEQMLSRVTEEAEVFRQNVRNALAEETLEQRAIHGPSRFRPRVGQAAAPPPEPHFRTREIVSEYSVGTLGSGDSERLVEFREVVSVDGQPVQSVEKARHALSLGITSNEDRVRKRMLEDFERHGLVGAVTDFGILLLEFTKRGIRDLKIEPQGAARIGPDDAVVLRYRQTAGPGGMLDFANRKAMHLPLQGLLYVRASDGLPLRITAEIHRVESGHEFDDQGTVDYVQTGHGFLGPVSVTHRGYVDKQLMVENQFRYAPFRRFSADAEVKFTELPEPPPAKP